MVVRKDILTTQRTYKDVDDLINEKVPGTSYAERIYNLYLNWKDTKGKTAAEIWWDDVRGKALLQQNIRDVMKEMEEDKNGRTI